MAPSRLAGGITNTRSVMLGRPLASSRLTSASPVPSSVIAVSMSSFGLARIVLAADFTAFWSRVRREARAAPVAELAGTESGTSSGF
jgi:hypothetical protein